MKTTSDINRDNEINALDYLTLKEIINYTFGDIDNNGIVDNKDIEKLDNYIKNNKDNINFSEKYDINHDGYVNDKDLIVLKAYLSNIKIGDVNKDTMVEDRDIKIINEYSESYYKTSYSLDKGIFNKNIDYRVNNPGIIDIDRNGIIYGLKNGEVEVEGITKNGLKDKIKVVVSNNNKLPTSIKLVNKKINLKYFDYENIDISKFDFNNDGVINNSDLDIANNIIKIKPTTKDLNAIIETVKNNKYSKRLDLNNDKKLNSIDISIIYSYLNNRKDGDLNNDRVLDGNDISLYHDYIDSRFVIKPIVLDKNTINSVYYYSLNNNIVNVNYKGEVVAKNKGTTYVNLLTVNGIKDSVSIEVK